jgi:preprotein translocase subunit SecA
MAQRDPLVEYQKEGYDLFVAMMDAVKEETVGFLFNVEVKSEAGASPLVEAKGTDVKATQYSYSSSEGSASSSGVTVNGVKVDGVTRNSPCPCGSGKKFKRCHGDPRNQ